MPRASKQTLRALERALLDTVASHGGQIERWLLDATELRAAERLVQRGLLERGTDEADGRRTIFALTDRAELG